MGAKLDNANLRHADLNGANLSPTNLCGADLREVVLQGTKLFGARCGQSPGERFAIFSHGGWIDADFWQYEEVHGGWVKKPLNEDTELKNWLATTYPSDETKTGPEKGASEGE